MSNKKLDLEALEATAEAAEKPFWERHGQKLRNAIFDNFESFIESDGGSIDGDEDLEEAPKLIAEKLKEMIAKIRRLEGVWKCFNCGFETSDKASAEAHFGDGSGEPALCVDWNTWTEAEKASELQNVIRELNQERKTTEEIEVRADAAEARVVELEAGVKSIAGKTNCKNCYHFDLCDIVNCRGWMKKDNPRKRG